jgi:glyceraldehyde 3-phosphate dehydrogenase
VGYVACVAINGYGRVGRCIVRALFERGDNVELVAINDPADNALLAHLTEFDSNHGRFPGNVGFANNTLTLGSQSIAMLDETDPLKLPWDDLGVDIVFGCSGRIKTRDAAEKHLQSGAKKILISAPMSEAEKTIVYGINHQLLSKDDKIVSNASCTTNCLAPVAQVIDESWGIETGIMTTVHIVHGQQHFQ